MKHKQRHIIYIKAVEISDVADTVDYSIGTVWGCAFVGVSGGKGVA